MDLAALRKLAALQAMKGGGSAPPPGQPPEAEGDAAGAGKMPPPALPGPLAAVAAKARERLRGGK